MATLHLLYRSTREIAELSIRYQFTYEGKEFIIGARTQKEVAKSFWDWYYLNTTKRSFESKAGKDLLKELKKSAAKCSMYAHEKASLKLELDTLKIQLQSFINERFKKLAPVQYTNDYLKTWLRDVVHAYYNPDSERRTLNAPTDLISYIDFFIENNDVNQVMRSKYAVLKSKLEKFKDYRRKAIEISEIDNHFRKEFISYCKNVALYSDHTIFRDFGYINTLCKSAGSEGIQLHKKQKDFRAPRVEKIFHEVLTPEEISTVENLDGLSVAMDNVRDLFLVSLYTGQRISDFMNFNKNMIREENGTALLEFEQSKTGELMSIPIIPKLRKILEKRNGDFPRKISDQKYNDYLKIVLKKAGFTKMVVGRKLNEVSPGVWRKQDVTLPRYEFFSSHSGRRTFATNAFGKMPISDIMYITGHTVEKSFLIYVNKKKTDRAHEAAPKLAALYSDSEQSDNKIDLNTLKQLQKLVQDKNIDLEQLLKTLNNT